MKNILSYIPKSRGNRGILFSFLLGGVVMSTLFTSFGSTLLSVVTVQAATNGETQSAQLLNIVKSRAATLNQEQQKLYYASLSKNLTSFNAALAIVKSRVDALAGTAPQSSMDALIGALGGVLGGTTANTATLSTDPAVVKIADNLMNVLIPSNKTFTATDYKELSTNVSTIMDALNILLREIEALIASSAASTSTGAQFCQVYSLAPAPTGCAYVGGAIGSNGCPTPPTLTCGNTGATNSNGGRTPQTTSTGSVQCSDGSTIPYNGALTDTEKRNLIRSECPKPPPAARVTETIIPKSLNITQNDINNEITITGLGFSGAKQVIISQEIDGKAKVIKEYYIKDSDQYSYTPETAYISLAGNQVETWRTSYSWVDMFLGYAIRMSDTQIKLDLSSVPLQSGNYQISLRLNDTEARDVNGTYWMKNYTSSKSIASVLRDDVNISKRGTGTIEVPWNATVKALVEKYAGYKTNYSGSFYQKLEIGNVPKRMFAEIYCPLVALSDFNNPQYEGRSPWSFTFKAIKPPAPNSGFVTTFGGTEGHFRSLEFRNDLTPVKCTWNDQDVTPPASTLQELFKQKKAKQAIDAAESQAAYDAAPKYDSYYSVVCESWLTCYHQRNDFYSDTYDDIVIKGLSMGGSCGTSNPGIYGACYKEKNQTLTDPSILIGPIRISNGFIPPSNGLVSTKPAGSTTDDRFYFGRGGFGFSAESTATSCQLERSFNDGEWVILMKVDRLGDRNVYYPDYRGKTPGKYTYRYICDDGKIANLLTMRDALSGYNGGEILYHVVH